MLRIHRTKLSQSKFSWMSWLGLAGTVSCCALILVFGFMLFPSFPQVVDAADWQPGVEQKPASDASVSISLPATIDFNSVAPTPDGATTTATADLTITTTNSASYSLYLYSSDSDNSLKPKISSLANISQINATAGDVGLTLSSLEPNTWGYSLGTSVPTDATTYSAVPTSNDTPIQTKDTSSTASANDTYTLSFGAKVDTTIPSGTYTGTLTVAVVAEPALVTLTFDGNGADGGSMSNQQIVAGQSANLNTNQYTRNGYAFTGWNTNAGGTGTTYADGANYTAPSSSAGQTITLYAQWKVFGKDTMQGFTVADCQSQASSTSVTLTDLRDNNTYTVRYINGACWMTQNLRIAGGTALNSSTSNVASNYTIPTTDLTTGDNSYTQGKIHNSGNTTNGYWYNFCAASAGTNCQNSTAYDTTYDICPKGWRLPTYSESSGISSYSTAFSPVTGGYYYGDALYGSSSGYWWSSTAYNNFRQYFLRYNGSSLATSYSNNGGNSSGLYVRCIRSN